MIPEATGTSRRSGGKGSIFFSYAWNDDASGYISAFHEAFVRRLGTKLRGQPQALAALGVEDADELVFFDQTNRAYMGSVRDWLKQRASAASFLVIFIDDDYLSSDWCLFEWECFQADFGQAALERLLIVELDKGLLDRHARELRQQATVGSINRADRLGLVSQCIRNAFYYEDGRRITARMNLNGKWPLNDEFVQQVEPLADEVLRRLQTPRSPGADPPVEGVDVIIGVSTADLGTSTAALEELLQRADVSVDHVTAEQIQGWTQEEGEAFFARGKALILPFSFRKINLLPMMRGGGHLRVQAEWFKRPDNLIWWRPSDGDEVEQREAHRPTLNGLVAGEFPVAGGGQRLIAGGPDLVMRALQEGTSGASDAVKIV